MEYVEGYEFTKCFYGRGDGYHDHYVQLVELFCLGKVKEL